MGVDHTCSDVRYLSEVLCCTIPIHMSDRLRKKNYVKVFLVKGFRSLYLLKFEPDLSDALHDTTLRFYAAPSPPPF